MSRIVVFAVFIWTVIQLINPAFGQQQLPPRPVPASQVWQPAATLPCPVAPLPRIGNAASPNSEPVDITTHSQDGLPQFTLADLEAMALANNPTLTQAAARVDAARGKYIQSGLWPNPEAGYLADEIGDQGKAGQQGAFVGQKIITAHKLQLNMSAAAQEIRQAECLLQAQRQRVLNDVHTGFYELQISRMSVDLNEQLLRVGREGLKAAEALQKAKEVSRVDTIQAKIEMHSAEIGLQNARNRCQATARRLAAVVGMPDLDLANLSGQLENMPMFAWEDALSRLMTESPELAQARAGVQRARYALQRQCAGRAPDVLAEASVKFDNATQNTIAGVSLGLPIPLFDRNQGNIRRAQAELIAAQHEVRRVELQLQERLAAVFQRYDNSRQQVDKYTSDLLPSAKESLDLVTSGYRQGEIPYLELLTAQRTYFRVNIAYLESLLEMHKSSVAIEGLLLSGSLGASGDALPAETLSAN